jgi:hypothetical protein
MKTSVPEIFIDFITKVAQELEKLGEYNEDLKPVSPRKVAFKTHGMRSFSLPPNGWRQYESEIYIRINGFGTKNNEKNDYKNDVIDIYIQTKISLPDNISFIEIKIIFHWSKYENNNIKNLIIDSLKEHFRFSYQITGNEIEKYNPRDIAFNLHHAAQAYRKICGCYENILKEKFKEIIRKTLRTKLNL